jgi:energy-coupling factor transporter ATP-binding protein EcfA2
MSADLPLIVQNLSFRYRARQDFAIRDISFQLAPGEMLLVAGASGCGKTTLARCINGLIPHSYKGERSGSILLYGKEVSGRPLVEVSQVVGTLLQDPERQIVASSVLGEIAFGPENLGLPRETIRQRIDEVVRRLGIENLRDRETFSLSGGEKQKVALAGVLAMQPSILILDEPLASLDPVSAHEAMAIFRRLADEGAAILMIEHRVEDVLGLRPERVLYMSGGETVYYGAPQAMFTRVDPREVKLPAQVAMERIRALGEIEEPRRRPPARPDGEAVITFEDVSFAYGDGPMVLRDVDLTIRQGDVVALLGPNGAGKTTLVKHAIGLLKPSTGRVLLGARDTRQMSVAQIAHSIGYVFQSPAHMLFASTVREELAFGPTNLGMEADDLQAGVREAVEVLNLEGLEEYSPLALSFGQQKRTTIAAVLAMRSSVLVMDEPTAGQDYSNYTRFMRAIVEGEGRGEAVLSRFAATLFITHDLDLAVCYANRVILISQGRIAADGPPQEVLADITLLERCRVVPTSLLRANLELLPLTGRFHPAEVLAGVGRD